MNALRLQVNNKTIYEGPSIAVPRVGEQIHHDGYVSHVLSVEWDFSTGRSGAKLRRERVHDRRQHGVHLLTDGE